MPTAEFRVFLNNEGIKEALLDRFQEIQVDQAIGMAAEAELRIDLAVDEGGFWTDLDEEFAQPMRRARVEIKIDEGDFVPLIDGPVVGQRMSFSASPGQSSLTLIVQDDTVLLNQEERVQVFEDTPAHQIARTLMQAAGLAAQVDVTPEAASRLERYTVQRGAAMRLLRELARRHGMFVYVRPGEAPGTSIGFFKRPDLTPGDLPELLVMGADRNVNHLTVEFDALRPTAVAAGSVRIAGKAVLQTEVRVPSLDPLGDQPVHAIVPPARMLLARMREEALDLDSAAQSAVNRSSWAYTARGEVSVDTYAGVLQPYEVVRVAGVGAYGGDYLVSRVNHTMSFEGYRQQFTLVRNARLESSSGGAGSPGVF
ncbi:MAG: phage late control D family protein [Bryobacteraceae bacterium]